MTKDIPDANMKLPERTIIMLKDINHRLIRHGFDNIKVLNSIAIVMLKEISDKYTSEELVAYIIVKVEELQRKGIVKDNARAIGDSLKEKKQQIREKQKIKDTKKKGKKK